MIIWGFLKMNLEEFDLEDLLLSAIKSEMESREVYIYMAGKAINGLLQDKLEFLAKEEEKHRLYIEGIYRKKFNRKKINIPSESPVPIPFVSYKNENVPLSKILKNAMESEKAASDFYKSLSDKFTKNPEIKNTLIYFSDMEMQHYKILEMEKESMERFEEGDVYWPMVHAGP